VKVVIMGCGRVGSTVAARLDADGHDVSIIDLDTQAFRRLAPGFGGDRLSGSGTDDRVLIAAGLREADAFLALTQGDNRNLMASQMAKHIFNVQTVVTRVYDPLRAELFGRLGLRTFSPTRISADLAIGALLGTS
jgi:trk system potassium uptake protein TrkA